MVINNENLKLTELIERSKQAIEESQRLQAKARELKTQLRESAKLLPLMAKSIRCN